jgi:NADPH-dependent curcumin reductase CurA
MADRIWNRVRDRSLKSKRPHDIVLFRNGEIVGRTTIPWTDPRFFKHEEVLDLAFQKLQQEDANPASKFKMLKWEEFSVFLGFEEIMANRRGQRIYSEDKFHPQLALANIAVES